MAIVTSDENLVIERDYTDNFSIKKTMREKYGKLYFPDVSLMGLNVGELGFVMEQLSNLSEDSFNTQAVLINEAFPNKAILPESIFSHAAVFQLDNTFSQCCECNFLMVLNQNEILELGVQNGNKIDFFIDKKTIFTVEEIPFTFDYDIKIEAWKKVVSGSEITYNFSAQYVFDSKNSISKVTNPYLKIRKVPNGKLLLQFTGHQVERSEKFDTIINNTKINCPVLEFSFEDMEGTLAGFDIFYKGPTDREWTQLEKLIKFSLPIKQKFCYYKLRDEFTLEITFSTREGYFQPEFNSEVRIVMYTTLGEAGKFDSYTGSHIEIQTFDDVYEENNKLTLVIKPVSDSTGAVDKLEMEALQALTVESYSNATELSSENDVMQYFYNFKYRYGNEILVIKRRDDVTERLFSAFLLLKRDDYIYPTNTLNLKIISDEFDTSYQNNRFTIRPGHIFRYDGTSKDRVVLVPDLYAWDTEALEEFINPTDTVYWDTNSTYFKKEADDTYSKYDREEQVIESGFTQAQIDEMISLKLVKVGTPPTRFAFTNPFLISMIRSPNLIGLYQTIAHRSVPLDFISENDQVQDQFITSKINLDRGLSINPEYSLHLNVVPSTEILGYDYAPLAHYARDAETGELIMDDETDEPVIESPKESKYDTEGNKVRIVVGFCNKDGDEVGYVEMVPIQIGVNDDISSVKFEAILHTDDQILSNGTFRITNKVTIPIHGVETEVEMVKPVNQDLDETFIPIKGGTLNIYILYKDEILRVPSTTKFTKYFGDTFRGYTVVNEYQTKDEKLTFIEPMNMMRSTVTFTRLPDELNPRWLSEISLLPMVKADILNDQENFAYFIERVSTNYSYLENCLSILRNNTNLDVKFYNTYGRSNNYIIGDGIEAIDRVNLDIKFQITLNKGVDDIEARRDISNFIKAFVEKVNSDGTNELFISNLISELETKFATIHHLKFLGINEYPTSYQTISARTHDLTDLTKEERRKYVPEVLVASTDHIYLNIQTVQ